MSSLLSKSNKIRPMDVVKAEDESEDSASIEQRIQ
jgi:hypothetical protein